MTRGVDDDKGNAVWGMRNSNRGPRREKGSEPFSWEKGSEPYILGNDLALYGSVPRSLRVPVLAARGYAASRAPATHRDQGLGPAGPMAGGPGPLALVGAPDNRRCHAVSNWLDHRVPGSRCRRVQPLAGSRHEDKRALTPLALAVHKAEGEKPEVLAKARIKLGRY